MAADRVTGKAFATRSAVMAPSAMAATSHPLATQIALDIMKNGGNAIDAAIAANAALGLMEPTGNGIGGDLYAIVWDAARNPSMASMLRVAHRALLHASGLNKTASTKSLLTVPCPCPCRAPSTAGSSCMDGSASCR